VGGGYGGGSLELQCFLPSILLAAMLILMNSKWDHIDIDECIHVESRYVSHNTYRIVSIGFHLVICTCKCENAARNSRSGAEKPQHGVETPALFYRYNQVRQALEQGPPPISKGRLTPLMPLYPQVYPSDVSYNSALNV